VGQLYSGRLMADRELLDLVHHGHEERNLEYKGRVNWANPEVQARITKCILALCNIRDGGAIVIGVEQRGEDFDTVGLDPGDRDSFTQDGVSAHVAEYADPYVELAVSHVSDGYRDFVAIQVAESAEIPVVCKRDGNGLRRGGIYTRTRRQNECAEIASQVEMREMLDIAIEKGIRAFDARAERAGYARPPTGPDDADLFRTQRDEL